ncbi:extracellular solute-binding protein [Gaiella sp.]|jgi:N,N'-diacetylchitobiose transport system substrate-binding protein|uniref:extracellular solute-binding protein n=1 Tax=Gaiella sp. TaxID=2663207 RepID=UPI002E352E4A|nr:extracellular solute-binding protein [Gaiella sp.]HEX5582418.1 extracellular solute-binding protein [Gaiella sp.]
MIRARIVGAVVLVGVALAAVASTASGGTSADSVTVWLQTDAQSEKWQPIVNAATAQFEKAHPGVTVDVQYQTWGDHLKKFDATLAGGDAPDVIEMGNTEMTKYMAAGAFQDLTSLKSGFANSSTWLAGLAAAGIYNHKVFGVPYYAGSRVVTYRTDLFKKAKLTVPRTLAQFTADAKKLGTMNTDKGFSPVYIAGTDWYVAMSFVYDYGGSIATQVGKRWKGELASPKSVAGLTAYKTFFQAASRASKTTDETHPNPYDVYAQGKVASMIGPGWFTCCVGKKYTKLTGQFVMPGHTAGKSMPGFLGGSLLAVPVGADKTLGADWIKAYTSNQSMTALRAIGNIPNTTSLLGKSVNERAATRSWFVPTAKNWVNVENGNILRNMLAQILTGKLSVKQAAQSANDNIVRVLNADV